MPRIALVILDWAGTTIDFGCLAPVAAFVESFARQGLIVTAAEARGPMGLHKRDHIAAMLAESSIAERWRDVHGRAASESDVDAIYREFVPLQMEVLDRHGDIVPTLTPCITEFRGMGVTIGATTGYFREAAERVYELAKRQGYAPDYSLCAEDVPVGRPAPWMIFRIMEAAGVYPPGRVAKVGDTVPDIEEGLNAGAWSIGVTESSSEVGYSASEWQALAEDDRQALRHRARSRLLGAGAHYVIDSLAELPALLRDLEAR
jgi:phosphonoacetaldehyde hydrolase